MATPKKGSKGSLEGTPYEEENMEFINSVRNHKADYTPNFEEELPKVTIQKKEFHPTLGISKIIQPNGEIRPIRNADLKPLIDTKARNLCFASCTIYSTYDKKFKRFNDEGCIIDIKNISSLDIIAEYTSSYDVFGNDLGDYIVDEEEIEEVKVKIDNKKKLITYRELINSFTNPVAFKNNIIPIQSNMDALVSCIVNKKDQFDEIFAIEVDRPESPLMRKYLTELAILVNEKLKESDEIDNIEELEKNAYVKAEYKGKSYETVVSESRDYHNYYRFLLTKDERVVITEEQNLYTKRLYNILKENSFHFSDKGKRNKFNLELEGELNSSNFYFSDKVDYINLSNPISLQLFTYVPTHLSNLNSHIEENLIDIRFGLISELIEKNYSKAYEVSGTNYSIFACDSNFNYGIFKVNKTSIGKWKKKLENAINKLEHTLGDKSMTKPYDVLNLSI